MQVARAAGTNHPLGGWTRNPKHQSRHGLWYARWAQTQPHPSYDIDGDGIVSNEDLAVAREFDRDGNGVLDDDEKRELRRRIAKAGIEQYYRMPHGPHVAKISAQVSESLVQLDDRQDSGTAPEGGQGRQPSDQIDIDVDSDAWHLQMDALTTKTRCASHFNSTRLQKLLLHDAMEAKPVNLVRELLESKQGGKAHTLARASCQGQPPSARSARSPRRKQREHLQGLFRSLDIDGSGTVDRNELGQLAGLAGRHLSKRQLDEAMQVMDGDGSGAVDVDEFIAWWEHGKILPAQGSRIFQRVSEQVERKVKNVRTIFRQFDENKDGTVSHHEFRVGLKNIGVDVSEAEFQELIRTVDEDNSGEIDYNEFAASGIIGGKLFAARTRSSGCRTRGELLEERKRSSRSFGQAQLDAFWARKQVEPRLSMPSSII